MTIEDIILDRDRRGVSELRPHLPPDFCDRAAATVLENPGPALIVTGFYILTAGAPETDGPPGAVAIGDALRSIGYDVVYVTDQHSSAVMSGIAGEDSRIVEFPIADEGESRRFAAALLAKVGPSIVIAIERCGLTEEGIYRNMVGGDITRYNARTDYLFSEDVASVGIGDGGNEIGMGNLAGEVTTVPSLVKVPCVTTTTSLIISSVSNWGGYGLVAAISRRKGRDLLPSIDAEQGLVRRAVAHGAVDGMSAAPEYKVDGFTLEENSLALGALHDLLDAEGLAP